MYLNEARKLAVLLTPKNASATVEEYARYSFGEMSGPAFQAALQFAGHPTLGEFVGAYSLDTTDYAILGVCRNPYDRFVSWCAHTYPEAFAERPQEVMADCIGKDEIGLRAQHPYLALATDVIAFEALIPGLEAWRARYGFTASIGHVNQSARGEYSQYYTPGLRAAVTRRYKDDLDAFGYSF